MPGTIIIQKAWFTREQLRREPGRLFIWGDNLARFGGANNPRSGQAFACRGEPNAVGVPTKRLPSMDDNAFFCDADNAAGTAIVAEIDAAFIRLAEHLEAGGTVVWPADGIGTGRAQLQRRAPAIWARIERYRLALFERVDHLIEA